MTSTRGTGGWAALMVAAATVLLATAMTLPAQSFTTLYTFDVSDGANPVGSLTQGIDGSLYGSTGNGGAYGYGTIFKMSPTGALTTLYSFCPQSGCADGANPWGVVQGRDGNFYGTTTDGGANLYTGTVFKITASGVLTTLYSFCAHSGCPDGEEPFAGLVLGADGDLYGTTQYGGTRGGGTVFKITASGGLSTLYSFCSQGGCTDGQFPYGLIQGRDGDFYGTTSSGGAHGGPLCFGNCGTVFKVTPQGTLTTLYSFCGQTNCTDGAEPFAGLVQAADGSFYGTTVSGGTDVYYGTVFRVTPNGKLTTLYSFCSEGTCLDGSNPATGLVEANDGNFYGTTSYGGANGTCSGVGCGTLFKVTPRGTLTTLYSFCSESNCDDGYYPTGTLIQHTSGALYGATFWGGINNTGTIFGLSVGLGPFVETVPTSGKVGTTIKILGTNLAGATSVTFNGTAATFKVLSSSLISTTVPAGATSGKVEVTTPTHMLSSNVPFQVKP